MSNPVINIKNISKQYRIGVKQSGRLKFDLQELWRGVREHTEGVKEAQNNRIWALHDINMSINQGDTLGFIGSNGAGKSTLLKILSKVTLPTSGSIQGRGRIASLLEVGTGFHPELTGRENIFLNGHILGMKRAEILRHFDEIVVFSGVEQFLDTPVKRYSSGMYLRLSFAVAAHLEAETLIVDEALAVGDAAFQAKCLQRMKQIAHGEGRTVIFVSHHMQAVRELCNKAAYLDHGRLVEVGEPGAVIRHYLKKEQVQFLYQTYPTAAVAPGNQNIRIAFTKIDIEGKEVIDTDTPLLISFGAWQIAERREKLKVGIHIFSFSGVCVLDLMSDESLWDEPFAVGGCTLPAGLLGVGSYYVSIDFVSEEQTLLYSFDACLSFDIAKTEKARSYDRWNGLVKPAIPVQLDWKKT